MSALVRFKDWLGTIIGRKQKCADLDEEMQCHLDLLIEDNLKAGMSPKQARQAAMREFGGRAQLKEQCQDVWGFRKLDELGRDLRLGARLLRTHPGFATVVILTLALGIGANTAIFSFVHTLLLKPLPYPDSERIVRLWGTVEQGSRQRSGVSIPDVLDWHQETGVFDAVTYYREWGVTVTRNGLAHEVSAENVSPGFFDVFQMPPLLGRTLRQEDWDGGGSSVVLSHRYWKNRLGGHADAVGKALRIQGEFHQVVGVMPATFREGNDVDLWVPRVIDKKLRTSRGNRHSYGFGRIKIGVPLADAQESVNRVAAAISKDFPESNTGRGVYLEPLHQSFVYDIRTALWILFGTVGCVLLIACVNVANLFLSRGMVREREFAVRASLGGSRRRLIQQVLGESVVLSVIGGIVGIGIAFAGIKLLLSIAPDDVKRLEETQINLVALAFSLVLSVVVGLVTGVLPAVRASRTHPARALGDDSRSTTASASSHRIRNTLVVAEVALALVLLVGAGLLVKSFIRLTSQPIGFDPENLVITGVGLPGSYDTVDKRVRTYEAVRDAFEKIPGVKSAAIATVPMRSFTAMSIQVEGRPVDLKNELTSSFCVVGGKYFETMGVPLLHGRSFAETDHENAPGVAIINQTLAKRYFGHEDVIGKRIRLEWEDDFRTIIGLVGDMRMSHQARAPEPDVFTHHAQMSYWGTAYALRVDRLSGSLEKQLREAAAKIDADLSLRPIQPFEDILLTRSSEARFQTFLLTSLAALAFILSAIGIYGMIAFLVRQRQKELEVRMALGARIPDIYKLVLGRGMKLTFAGIAIGLVAAVFLTRVLTSMLYDVNPLDLGIFLGIPLIMLLVATLASLLPIQRIAAAGPTMALRE